MRGGLNAHEMAHASAQADAAADCRTVPKPRLVVEIPFQNLRHARNFRRTTSRFRDHIQNPVHDRCLRASRLEPRRQHLECPKWRCKKKQKTWLLSMVRVLERPLSVRYGRTSGSKLNIRARPGVSVGILGRYSLVTSLCRPGKLRSATSAVLAITVAYPAVLKTKFMAPGNRTLGFRVRISTE